MAQGTLTIDGRSSLPSTVFDHAGFRRWATSGAVPEDVRVCFVQGEVLLEMAPESTESHNKVKVKITEVLSRLVDAENLGELYGDGVLFTNESAGISTEPDCVFVSWASLRAKKVMFVEKAGRPDDAVELVGTPDLVVEVISDTSKRKDTTLLRDGYARAGIPEYWLVDARHDTLSFVVLKLVDGTYRSSNDGAPQESEVFGRSFVLRRERNEVGRWRYALDERPTRGSRG